MGVGRNERITLGNGSLNVINQIFKDVWVAAISGVFDVRAALYEYFAGRQWRQRDRVIDWTLREREINGVAYTPAQTTYDLGHETPMLFEGERRSESVANLTPNDSCECGVSAGSVHNPGCPVWMQHDSGYTLAKHRCENCGGDFVAVWNGLCWVCQYHMDKVVRRLKNAEGTEGIASR